MTRDAAPDLHPLHERRQRTVVAINQVAAAGDLAERSAGGGDFDRLGDHARILGLFVGVAPHVARLRSRGGQAQGQLLADAVATLAGDINRADAAGRRDGSTARRTHFAACCSSASGLPRLGSFAARPRCTPRRRPAPPPRPASARHPAARPARAPGRPAARPAPTRRLHARRLKLLALTTAYPSTDRRCLAAKQRSGRSRAAAASRRRDSSISGVGVMLRQIRSASRSRRRPRCGLWPAARIARWPVATREPSGGRANRSA